MISGFYRPDAGSIRLGGVEVVGRSPARIARLYVGRTFQTPKLLPELSAIENVMLGGYTAERASGLEVALRLPRARREQRALEARARRYLDFVGLGERDVAEAGDLSHGQQRLAEIARAMIGTPRLLLLDEPAAGLSLAELDRLGALIDSIRALGVTVVIVEHRLELVASICSRVTVLDRGTVLAGGTPAEVFSNPAVVRAYMGARKVGATVTGPLLRVEDMSVGYGHVGVLEHVSLEVAPGSIVALVGSNGAGKSTMLRAISGLLRPQGGRIVLDGRDITGARPDRIVEAGILHVAEGRRLFRRQTVMDNLELGLYGASVPREAEARRYERIFELFPALAERRRDRAGVLSGGQQQMLAVAQALMREPRLLMLDEPSLGLAPVLVDEVLAVIAKMRDAGTAVLLVEQMVERALEVADRGYVLQNGRIIGAGTPRELANGDLIRRAYIGATTARET